MPETSRSTSYDAWHNDGHGIVGEERCRTFYISEIVEHETGVTKPFAMSLLPYSSTMLEEALHQDELPEPKHIITFA